ncbi:MAG: hypothetical protein ACE362_02955 [Phaeodactylibacter xiamenensis]|uniref:Uncharacterized protein n=1 Tax=Phaeodactylibacter xiamenensis TaxID=1524460 RepID=A0A098S196_9BACT|nr:hypothetical protein [Phaeodactylibacter xiamenensis]KGE85821.1 hypothetical protein IX84_24625 [Phaeodactylibacter xiamenensis]MCR9051197.1 hypothetical protein [bacterium]
MRKLVISGLFFLTCTLLSGQDWGLSIGKEWSSHAEEAISGCFYVVRVDYVLEEIATGDKYGRDGKEYFSRLYTTGVAVDGKIWVDGEWALQPDKSDEAYSVAEYGQGYIPRVSKYGFRSVKEFRFSELYPTDITDTLTVDGQTLVAFSLPDGSPSFEATQKLSGKGLFVHLEAAPAFANNELAPIETELTWQEIIKPTPSAPNGRVRLTDSKKNAASFKSGVVLEVAADSTQRIVFKAYGFSLPSARAEHWEVVLFPQLSNTSARLTPLANEPEEAEADRQSEIKEEEEAVEQPDGEEKEKKFLGIFKKGN